MEVVSNDFAQDMLFFEYVLSKYIDAFSNSPP